VRVLSRHILRVAEQSRQLLDNALFHDRPAAVVVAAQYVEALGRLVPAERVRIGEKSLERLGHALVYADGDVLWVVQVVAEGAQGTLACEERVFVVELSVESGHGSVAEG